MGKRRDGSTFSRPASHGEKRFVEAVGWAARSALVTSGGTLAPPYGIVIEFFMPSPARPSYPYPTSSGDVDKLCRSALDGLVAGGLLVDDRHVVGLPASKRFADAEGARTVIEVRSVALKAAGGTEAA